MRPWLAVSFASIALAGNGVRQVSLFALARSKNANVVEYSARLGPDGRLDPVDPIATHWIMNAEDGRRQDLDLFEQALAYGVSAHVNSARDRCDFTIVSLPQRRIQVRRHGHLYEADTEIGGASARLTRIFVTTDETAVPPRVLAIDLWGRRLSDGAPVHERLERAPAPLTVRGAVSAP
ncbi:MAG TPA: DUF4833 domain-containing protein [Myxococcales bacterium]|nr:DUF4833 domain-containing protein [Myxococcales bacterium]